MNTTRQSKTWPYDLVKGIILLILLGLMLYLRPDMSAQIQRQLGLPFGTVTELDAPQLTGGSTTTLSGHTQSGATVELFAGDASLGTVTAGPDGSWSLPVTVPPGASQLRAQARDAAGAALGSAAVLELSSEQQAAIAAAATTPAAADQAQQPASDSQAGGDTSTGDGAAANTGAATDSTSDSATDSATAADTEAAAAAESAGAATAAESMAQAPAIAPPEIAADGVTFTGSGEPGTTIMVVSAAGTVGTAEVNSEGSWTLQVQLAPGKYELQARATDASGAAAGNSPVVAITVPATGTANTQADGATDGATDVATDGATADASTAAAGSVDTAAQRGNTVPSASAQGSLGAAQVADGTANLSGSGTPGTTVELVAIAATGSATTGSATTGSATTGATPNSAGNKGTAIARTGSGEDTATGTAAAGAGTNATRTDATEKTVLGSVVVAADGTWQLTAKVDPGDYTLAVRTLDADGAIVDESEGVPLSVPEVAAAVSPAAAAVAATGEAGQSTLPGAAASTAVTATVPVTRSASTASSSSAASSAAPQVSAPVVSGGKVTLTGTAAPGAAVELVTNDEVMGEAAADADGLWIVAVQLDPASYAVRIRATNPADKSVQYSRVVSLTVPAGGTTVEAGATITQATAAAVGSTAAPTVTTTAAAIAETAVAAAVPATTTTALAAAATKATAAVTDTTLGTAANVTEATTVTTTAGAATVVTTTTPTAATAAATASLTASLTSAKTPGVTPSSAKPSETITSTARAASSAAVTTTSAAGAAASTAPASSSVPPTLSQPEISGNTLTLSGTGTPGTSVEIVSGTTVLGKATVADDGTWSLSSEVKPGSYKLQVVRRDAAGEVISQSPVVSLDIPAASVTPELDKPEIAADNTITLTGTGTPGSVIEIVQDGAVIATADVQDDGQWSYSYPAAKTGNVQVAAQLSGRPATRTRPVIVVVPVVVAPAAPAPAAEATVETAAAAATEVPAEAAASAEQGSAEGGSGSSGGQAHVVQPGDTLTSLALTYLGSERRYPEIVAATNEMAKQDPAYKQITDPNLIVVGQQLWIPAP